MAGSGESDEGVTGMPGAIVHSVDGFEAALDALDAHVLQCERRSKSKLRVWLSGGLSRPFLLTAPPRVSETKLRRIAAGLACEQTGLEGECRLWMEDGGRAGARLVVAVPSPVLQALSARLEGPKRARTHLLSIRPWWVDVLRVALHGNDGLRALAVQDCDSLTLLAGSGRQFDAAQTLTPLFDLQTAEAALARKLVTLDLDAVNLRRARLRRQVLESHKNGGGAWGTAPKLTLALLNCAELCG